VIRTRVGYAGGDRQDPTYSRIGDHAETIQIDYDPAVISYEELLAMFWSGHTPISPSSSRQYASIIHYATDEQRLLAEQSLQAQEKVLDRKVYTEIIPLGTFTLAEDYHQKYYLQNQPALMGEFSAMYPDMAGFINSTAAARANGYVGRNGSLQNLQAEIDLLGLSEEGQGALLRYFK
jgi:peptide-methionine (S)-S-oxide reductase